MSQTPDEVSTLAYQWIVQRVDGAGFAATSLDRRQQLGVTTFEPDVDLQPSELVISDAMFGSRFEVRTGAGTGAAAGLDLSDGSWAGASLTMLASDWLNDAGGTLIARGELGQPKHSNGKLSMSVDVLPAALRELPCIQTSPECRAVLGDNACRIDLRTRRRRVQVIAVDETGLTVDEEETERFRMGRLRWVRGANCGTEQVILDVNGPRLILGSKPSRKASAGDLAILVEGCDGRRTTCSERFGNILNFRGEPDLPGSEILLRFPGA